MTEVVYCDELAAALFEAITDARAPNATVDWEHLGNGDRTFYREAAHRLQASGAMTMLPLADGAVEDESAEGVDVINVRRALQVGAISIGILRGENGQPAVVGHFGGHPRGEPERSVGVAFLMHPQAVAGMFRQVIEAAAAVDLEVAGSIVGAAVAAMNRAIEARPDLVIPAIRPTNARRN